MEQASVGLALAFSAGLLSFVSPCVLPLIPSYLTFVTGVGFDELGNARRAALVHALLFVLGFTLIFVTLGASATVLGRLLVHYRVWITRFGGALIVVFGLYLLGALRIASFDRERRVHLASKPVGYLGSVFVGIAFGAGWTPCLGPPPISRAGCRCCWPIRSASPCRSSWPPWPWSASSRPSRDSVRTSRRSRA
jgi:cytochrome c-type biogenesis protein